MAYTKIYKNLKTLAGDCLENGKLQRPRNKQNKFKNDYQNCQIVYTGI